MKKLSQIEVNIWVNTYSSVYGYGYDIRYATWKAYLAVIEFRGEKRNNDDFKKRKEEAEEMHKNIVNISNHKE